MVQIQKIDWGGFYGEAAELCHIVSVPKPYTAALRISSVANMMDVREESLRMDHEVDTKRELRKLYRSFMSEYLARKSCPPEEEEDHEQKVLVVLKDIFTRKNHDYGSSFADLGLISVLVRLYDKAKRAESLSKKKAKVLDELIEDTLLDGANYSIMALAYILARESLT